MYFKGHFSRCHLQVNYFRFTGSRPPFVGISEGLVVSLDCFSITVYFTPTWKFNHCVVGRRRTNCKISSTMHELVLPALPYSNIQLAFKAITLRLSI